ncbi:MAG: hypothetical protein ACR2N2_08720, partial [Acidimicrobiia bacterium]
GYERAQVDTYLSDIADRLSALEDQLAESGGRDVALGIDEHEALGRELQTIGGDIADMLEAARSTAEGMRTRAGADADRWRTEAETESAAMVTDATEASQSLRAAAWNEGSSLLKSSEAEAQATISTAKEEALFVRAEAEREALRLTGDARRDREETIRATRLEADQIIESARTESEGVLAAAGQQADLAQERARALEDRRSELLSELEATRASIGDLESEIESRRQELETPEPEPEPLEDARSHHSTDSGSVRIVSSTNVVALEPVDAEELAAEVEALRSGAVLDQPEEATPQDEQPVAAAPGELEPMLVPATDPLVEETPYVELPEQEPEPEPEVHIEAEAEVVTDSQPELVPDPVVPETEPEPTPHTGGDTLGSLFAQLREPQDVEAASDPEPLEVEPAVAEDDTPETAVPAEVSETPAEAEVPDAPANPAATVPADDAATAIPLQNAALRTIKRTLVELQNEALEQLRNDASWSPGESFTDEFAEPFAELTTALTGSPDPDPGQAFGADLYDAISSAIDHAREAGAGEREVSSAASKVFRTWRSDEAERRVTSVTESLSVNA